MKKTKPQPFAKLLANVCRPVSAGGRGLTIVAIAKKADMSRQHIYNILRGDAQPGDWVVKQLALAMRCTIAEVRQSIEVTRMTTGVR